MTGSDELVLDCPICSKKVVWSDRYPFRPFCSKRCQQIDLGNWASEKNSIPGDTLMDANEDTKES